MAKRRLTNAQIFHFFEEMQALISAGVTPFAALQVMKRSRDQGASLPLLDGLSEALDSGQKLSEAIEASGAFPPYVHELLSIGEQTGRLDTVCASLARYYEDEDELQTAVRSAVSYPIVMIGMMFAVVIVLLSKVMPVFTQVFSQLGATAGGLTLSLMRVSRVLSRYYAVLAGIFALLVLLYLYFSYTEKGRARFLYLMENAPLARRFSEDLALTRFAGGLQLTTASGLDPYTSLELTGRLAGNRRVREKIRFCIERLKEGESFSEAVAHAELFDSFYTGLIGVFAEAGSVDQAMAFIASHYKEQTARKINRLLSSIEPAMVAILSVIVGMILLSVILPLMGIMSNIG